MKRTLHLMLVVALTLPLIAIAGDVPGPTPDPGATKKVYGDTPEELLPYGRFTEPYKTFFLEPNEYRGYGRHIPEPEQVESVKIGFLGPIESTVSVATGGASHEEPLGRKMLQGARLAIEDANASGSPTPPPPPSSSSPQPTMATEITLIESSFFKLMIAFPPKNWTLVRRGTAGN